MQRYWKLSKASEINEMWYKKVANRYSNIFDPELNHDEVELVVPGLDDRLVFMESNPMWQLYGAAGLAAASRVLKVYNPKLAKECIDAAEDLWQQNKDGKGDWINPLKMETLVELILTTDKEQYKEALCKYAPQSGKVSDGLAGL